MPGVPGSSVIIMLAPARHANLQVVLALGLSHRSCDMVLYTSTSMPVRLLPSAPQDPAEAPLPPELTASVLRRLGCLFTDFKGKPLTCTAFFGAKLAVNIVKGIMAGCMFGEGCLVMLEGC